MLTRLLMILSIRSAILIAIGRNKLTFMDTQVE